MLIFNKDFGLGTMNDQGGGTVINNQDITITENGEYTADEGYTGIGTATVNVPEADVITATNNIGSAITAGDKVWVNNEPFYSKNFNTIGSPIIDYETGVVSGFSNSNYLQLPEVLDFSQPFQIYVKFTTTNNVGYRTIIGPTVQYSFVPFYFDQGSFTLLAYASSNGSSWNLISGKTIKTCAANTTYTMMVEFTGSAYIWYEYSGGSWVELARKNTSAICYNSGPLKIGQWQDNYWTGSIDLSETYINVNGVRWWTPTFTKLSDYTIENLNSALLYEFSGTKKGSIIVSNNMASNFAQSSYVEYTQSIDFSIPWEFNTCVYRDTTDYTTDRNGFIYSSVDNTDQSIVTGGFGLYCDTKINFSGGSSGVSISSTAGSIQTNKTYYIKCGWTGTQYYIKQSGDGVTYTTVATADSTTPCVQTNTKINIGSSNWVSGFYWHGYIYLQDTFIVQNGQKVFSCCTNKSTLTGYAQENIASGSTGDVKTLLGE